MTKTLPLWAALLFGVICGAVIGTIVAAFYLTLALKTGFASFDMLTLWKASAGTRAAHPEDGHMGIGTDTPSTRLHVNGPMCTGSYTVAGLPSASASGAGALVFVSDETGGAVMAFSDGTDWRRTTDRAVVS